MGVVKFKRRRIGWFPLSVVGVFVGAFLAVLLLPDPFASGPNASTGASANAHAGDGGAMARAGGPAAASFDTEEAYFPLCDGPVRVTCVVDGDTIWYRGEKIRLVGFDTPETWKPACPRERELGEQATRRLRELLNAGPFSLDPNPEGDAYDRYDRALLVASRGGRNLGHVLVDEGLAERRGGWGKRWC